MLLIIPQTCVFVHIYICWVPVSLPSLLLEQCIIIIYFVKKWNLSKINMNVYLPEDGRLLHMHTLTLIFFFFVSLYGIINPHTKMWVEYWSERCSVYTQNRCNNLILKSMTKISRPRVHSFMKIYSTRLLFALSLFYSK